MAPSILCIIIFQHNASSIHGEIQNYTSSSSTRPMSPVKYPSLMDETEKKNFFPITWRVIGGGVRVGVAKESDRDLSLDNGNTSTPHKPSQLPPLKLPSSRRRSNSIPSTPSNTLFSVEQVRYISLYSICLSLRSIFASYFPRNHPESCRTFFGVVHVPLTFGIRFLFLGYKTMCMILFNIKCSR